MLKLVKLVKLTILYEFTKRCWRLLPAAIKQARKLLLTDGLPKSKFIQCCSLHHRKALFQLNHKNLKSNLMSFCGYDDNDDNGLGVMIIVTIMNDEKGEIKTSNRVKNPYSNFIPLMSASWHFPDRAWLERAGCWVGSWVWSRDLRLRATLSYQSSGLLMLLALILTKVLQHLTRVCIEAFSSGFNKKAMVNVSLIVVVNYY